MLSTLEDSTSSSFEVFSGGRAVNKDAKVHEVLDFGSRLLLYAGTKEGSASVSKPRGFRWWCRFPTHVTSSAHETGTSNHLLCFKSEKYDVLVYGLGIYALCRNDATQFRLRDIVFRVTDEQDDNTVSRTEVANQEIDQA